MIYLISYIVLVLISTYIEYKKYYIFDCDNCFSIKNKIINIIKMILNILLFFPLLNIMKIIIYPFEAIYWKIYEYLFFLSINLLKSDTYFQNHNAFDDFLNKHNLNHNRLSKQPKYIRNTAAKKISKLKNNIRFKVKTYNVEKHYYNHLEDVELECDYNNIGKTVTLKNIRSVYKINNKYYFNIISKTVCFYDEHKIDSITEYNGKNFYVLSHKTNTSIIYQIFLPNQLIIEAN